MRSSRFHSDAEDEMILAAAWYETKQRGLGNRFLSAVQASIRRIEAQPKNFPKATQNVRRCLVRGFPYGVLFREHADFITIMAVMHVRREPDYWQDRDASR